LPEGTLDQFSKIEAALLRYFKAHANQVVSTEQLLAEVWKRPDASNRRVQEAIRRLRLQLEEMAIPIGAIENDRGRGYRFVPANASA
jgi:DNA-binding response OmpR family regulator